MQHGVTFYLDTQPVGWFVDAQPPVTEGEYRYEPFRGPGHYNLLQGLDASHTQRCHYECNGKRVEFSVVGHSGYGVLTLVAFASVSALDERVGMLFAALAPEDILGGRRAGA